MRRQVAEDEEDDDDRDDDDEALEGVYDDEDDDLTVPCPYCQRPIHEDSQRCPYCEKYLSGEDAPPERKPLWIIIGALLCLGIVCCWMMG